MSSSQRADKESRLIEKREIGERLKRFVDDPIISRWFEAAEHRLIEEMIAAAPEDDEVRRGRALQLKALKELWTFIERAAREGSHAAEQIDKLNETKRMKS